MPLLQIVSVSTRPGRLGPHVARWFYEQAGRHGKFETELVDLAEVNLPLFDEPHHPKAEKYAHEHTKRWSAIVRRADAFVFVTPEYNHSTPAPLVNAFNYLVNEWAYKPVGFVGYGGVSGGMRSIQMSKMFAVALRMVPVLEAVVIPAFTNYLDKEKGTLTPEKMTEDSVAPLLDELLKLANALKPIRS